MEIISEIGYIEEWTEGIFPINLKLIGQFRQKDHRLMAKYHKCIYNTGSFFVRVNINLNFIMCEDNIFMPLILQSYALN